MDLAQAAASSGGCLHDPEVNWPAVDDQLAFDAIACAAEQLQIIQPRTPALGNRHNVIEDQPRRPAAVQAAFAISRDQFRTPALAICLQCLPFAAFDLWRHSLLVRLLAERTFNLSPAPRQKCQETAARRMTSAAMSHAPAIAAVHVSTV